MSWWWYGRRWGTTGCAGIACGQMTCWVCKAFRSEEKEKENKKRCSVSWQDTMMCTAVEEGEEEGGRGGDDDAGRDGSS